MPGDFQRVRLGPVDPRPDFDCGDQDLNEFFHADSIKACRELMAVTYALTEDDKVLAFYCVSNDSIRVGDFPSRRQFKRLQLQIESPEKRYSSMPAVKIGRFAVCADRQSDGIGSKLMSAIKYDFTNGNKTGCRFIVVDAYNTPKVVSFYQKNGFEFLKLTDAADETRLMFYDLIKFIP